MSKLLREDIKSTITSAFYRSISAVILVYDITYRTTFDSIDRWTKELDMYVERNNIILIIVYRFINQHFIWWNKIWNT